MPFDDRAFILGRLPHGSCKAITCPRIQRGQTIVEHCNQAFAAWNNKIRAGRGVVVITRIVLGPSIDIKASDVRRLLVSALHNHRSQKTLDINPPSAAQSASAINWVEGNVELGIAISG